MDTKSASAANLRYPCALRPLPRRLHTGALVTALYVLTVLGAPWIVRYAPDAESLVVESLARTPVVRCAAAPEFGMPCGAWLPQAGPGRPTGAA